MGVRLWFCMCLFALCVPLVSSLSSKVLYSANNAIMEFDLDTRTVTKLLEPGSNRVFAMDYDYKHRFIYFPRYDTNDIVRFAYPSSNRTLQTVVQTDPFPSGIAVDSTNEHIYWVVPAGTNTLSRCNLDGSNLTLLTTLSVPYVVRLDVTNRWMYIVKAYIGVMKLRFDIAEQQMLVNITTSAIIHCMDIDTDESRVYWFEGNGELISAKDDGSDIKTIISTNTGGNNFGLRVSGSYLYYAGNKQLLMVNKTPVSTPTVLYNDTSRIESIFVFNQSGM
ncbi:unnamed protein product [Mytilus coruscus]|uniref:Prolow-density lipoprotein receptor-related protein 1-like beta-propeller domain-containing protein n=1 Tax=Mytilus coruscus TaxID=42192 RepID=A0A6J8B0H1_MYTCO|nr:unnamed protein product [Mytilus coruscus]